MTRARKAVRVFFDTEFTTLSVHEDIQLISIGCISQHRDTELDGRVFYVELSDTWTKEHCTTFVVCEVLPKLQGGPALMKWEETGPALVRWIEAFRQPVIVMTDSLSYDGLWISELFRKASPRNFIKVLPITFDTVAKRAAFNRVVERCFRSGFRRHHALDDARANRLGWVAATSNRLNDAPLASARRRAERFREAVLAAPDMVTEEEFTRRSGLSPAQLSHRVAIGSVLALSTPERGTRYPAWQLEDKVQGAWLERILLALPADPWTKYAFFITTEPLLDNHTPLDVLRRGTRTDEVLFAAMHFMELP